MPAHQSRYARRLLPVDPLRLREHIHGHLAWLAAAALTHPAVLLRRGKRKATVAVLAGPLLATATAVLGFSLYDPYRASLRQSIYEAAPRVGYLFERKEHLGIGAVLLGWAGVAAYFASGAVAEDAAGPRLRRAAHLAFVASATCAVCAALLGMVVASVRTF